LDGSEANGDARCPHSANWGRREPVSVRATAIRGGPWWPLEALSGYFHAQSSTASAQSPRTTDLPFAIVVEDGAA
jgi:hypothetical protein